jgi:hypothetical protein
MEEEYLGQRLAAPPTLAPAVAAATALIPNGEQCDRCRTTMAAAAADGGNPSVMSAVGGDNDINVSKPATCYHSPPPPPWRGRPRRKTWRKIQQRTNATTLATSTATALAILLATSLPTTLATATHATPLVIITTGLMWPSG